MKTYNNSKCLNYKLIQVGMKKIVIKHGVGFRVTVIVNGMNEVHQIKDERM